MYFHIIASGSKGNATIVANKNTRILIDMGISLCRLEEGLSEIGLNLKQIDGAIFTHNHSDHIGGIKFLSPKKMYGLKGTLPTSLTNLCELNKSFIIGDMVITPFKTSHDAKNPCGYKVESDGKTLIYMTDTGIFLEENLPIIKNPNYLLIESNHDLGMLMASQRPYCLKERIFGDHGHLCNEDSAIASVSILGDKTEEIVLMHLSEECNTPEKALNAYKNVFNHFNKDINTVKIRCSNQRVSLSGGDLNDN